MREESREIGLWATRMAIEITALLYVSIAYCGETPVVHLALSLPLLTYAR